MKAAVLTILIAVASAFAASGQGVDLARLDGWNIVIPEAPIPSELRAAQEFQNHFELASGHKLEIVIATSRPDRHIFLGAGKAMRASAVGFDVDEFGPEDLRIIIRDDNIAIAGGRTRGTLYGVYTFLEDYLGVRFLTRDHTHVPPVGRWRVVGPVDRFYHPPFVFRYLWCGETWHDQVYSARRRNNATTADAKFGGGSRFGLINHSFYHQVPVAKYGKEHPEYYCLMDGKRKILFGRKGIGYNQLCLTNPDVLKIVTKAVLRRLKKNPNVGNISVSQNDGAFYCQCPKCAAIDEREGTHMGSLLKFVNAVADEVAKEYPDVLVGTLAYGWSVKPPKTIKPRPNVEIQLCSAGCCQLHPLTHPNDPSESPKFCKSFSEWGKVCKNIFIWNYNANFSNFGVPWPNLRSIEPNMRYFVANNAKGVFMQAGGAGMNFSDLRNYMITGLLWDPSRSGEQLMEEFLHLHYGRAAGPIRRFIDLMHDRVDETGHHLSGSMKYCKDYGIDAQTAQEGFDLFVEAVKLADNDVIRKRVEKASICAYKAVVDPIWRVKSKEDVAALDPALVDRMRPLLKRLFELCEEHGVKLDDGGRTTMKFRYDRLQPLFNF